MGVLGFYGSSLRSGGVGVRTFTLSFDSTTDRSFGTSLVALKLAVMFAFKNTYLNTFAKVAIKAFLSILLM